MTENGDLTVAVNLEDFDSDQWTAVALAALDAIKPEWRDGANPERLCEQVVEAMVHAAFRVETVN